jgi:hypothetical protein
VQEGGEEVARKLLRVDIGGELGEGQEEAERRDDGEVDRWRWTERPPRCSSVTPRKFQA